ncbi:MAG: hypothetical protein ABL916_18580 [Burkholderiaceae bacterium]
MTTLRIRVPALVQAPRGALAAADLMVQLLRGIASLTAAVLAPARGRVVPAPVSGLHD